MAPLGDAVVEALQPVHCFYPSFDQTYNQRY
jgi:hypothetical protein